MRAFKTIVYAVTAPVTFVIINSISAYFFTQIDTNFPALDKLLIAWILILFALAVFWSFFGLTHLLETSTCISYAVIPTVLLSFWYLKLDTIPGFLSTLLNAAITVIPLILRHKALKKKAVQQPAQQTPIIETPKQEPIQPPPIIEPQPIEPEPVITEPPKQPIFLQSTFQCPYCSKVFSDNEIPKFCPKCGHPLS